VVVVVHFRLTARFLHEGYDTYGWDVLSFYSMSQEEQGDATNPLCHLFPRMASCNYYRFGSAGFQEKINAICVLALNVINDKVFAITWCWSVLLALLSTTRLFYRAAICSSSSFRLKTFKVRIRRILQAQPQAAEDMVSQFIRSLPLGDWFVLHQLSKNLNRHFFVDFLVHLSTLEESEGEGGDAITEILIRPDQSKTLKLK